MINFGYVRSWGMLYSLTAVISSPRNRCAGRGLLENSRDEGGGFYLLGVRVRLSLCFTCVYVQDCVVSYLFACLIRSSLPKTATWNRSLDLKNA